MSNDRGAGSSEPRSRGGSNRLLMRSTHRNFQRVFGGCGPAPPVTTTQARDPICTLGGPTARASPLDGALFSNWARRSRCGLSYDVLRVLNEEAWDIWCVTQLVHVLKGAYQIPRALRCGRAFVSDSLAVRFAAWTSTYVYSRNVDGQANPIGLGLDYWGFRLPDYAAKGSAICTRSRESYSFKWAILVEGGLVVTMEDWEITKGLSSRPTIRGMSVSDLVDRGFHRNARDCFSPTPPSLRRIWSVPVGSSIPPLWSLRFFAEHVFGRGAPDGSCRAGVSERQHLADVMGDEIVLCLALGVAAEREANKRTQVVPLVIINKLRGYDGPDVIPTRRGPISIREVGARLAMARTISADHHVVDRVIRPLYFVPDYCLDDQALAFKGGGAADVAESTPSGCVEKCGENTQRRLHGVCVVYRVFPTGT